MMMPLAPSRPLSRNSQARLKSSGGHGPPKGEPCLPELSRSAEESDASEQDEDQHDDDDEAETAAAIIAGPVERATADAGKAAEQRDDENDQDDSADGHVLPSRARQRGECALPSPRKLVGTSKVPAGIQLNWEVCLCGRGDR